MKPPTILFLLWVFVFSLVYFHTTDSFNQDLGRHIKLGEIIWQEKDVPKTNLFSYTNPNEPVFNSHWGSQVIFYFVHQAFGINGLILLNTIVNTATFGLLGWLAVRRVGIVIPSLLFIPIVFLLLDRTWIRPEMFGNLFYAMLLIALFSKRVRKRLKWFFPLIILLWINLHITAVFGVFAMGLILLQDSLERVRGVSARGGPAFGWGVIRGIKENALILLATLAALLINPYGIEGVRSAFTVLDKYGYTIVENQSWLFLRDFALPAGRQGFPIVSHIFFGFFVLICSFFVALLTKRKPSIGELLLLLAISALTLRFVRNEVLFAYTAFLTATFNFGSMRAKQFNNVPLSLAAIIVSIFIIVNNHNSHNLPIGFGSRENYKAGVDYFIDNNLGGPIFNNFDIGGYLIYRLYPKELVFVDNRPEAYPVNFFEHIYKPMQFSQEVFDKQVQIYGIKTIIWGYRDITDWSVAFTSFITKHPNWQQAYLDDSLVIFTRTP